MDSFHLFFPNEFFPRYENAEENKISSRKQRNSSDSDVSDLSHSSHSSYSEEIVQKLLPSEFKATINIQSASVITNLNVSHSGCTFEQSEDGLNVKLYLELSTDIPTNDIVVSYSTEWIRVPKLTLVRWPKYPDEIVAHISYIPRGSEEHELDGGKFSSFITISNSYNIYRRWIKRIWHKSDKIRWSWWSWDCKRRIYFYSR